MEKKHVIIDGHEYIAEDTVSKDASGEQQGSYLHELRTNKKSFLSL